MEAIAKTRHLKGSPRKARLVIDLIRGRNVSQALNILKFTDKRAAEPITKTLRSAIANATYLAEQQNIAIDPDDLFVKTCFVDMGAHKNRRRMRPAPQGRAFREQRHYCHITILVSSDAPAVKEADANRIKGKKLLAKEAQAAEPKTKTPTEPKAEKKTAKAKIAKEEINLAATPIAVEETKLAKSETIQMEEAIETPTAQIETPQAIVETETPTIEEPAVEEAKEETPQVAQAKDTPELTETPKVEQAVAVESEAAEKPEIEEAKSEETVEADKPQADEVTETETAKAGNAEASDILEMDSPKAEAKEKTDKQKAEASDAKNAQSQTPAERNETKKADNAQLDENDILELQ